MNNLLAEAKDVTSSKANSTVNCLIKSSASVGKHNYVNSCKFSYQLVIPSSRFTNIHDNTTQPYLTLSMKAWIFPPIVSTISLVETIINRYQYVHFGKNRYIPLRQLKPLDGATQLYIIQVICKINSTSRVLLL